MLSIEELHDAFKGLVEKFTSGLLDFPQYSHGLFLLKAKADAASLPFKFYAHPSPSLGNGEGADDIPKWDGAGINEIFSSSSEDSESSSSNGWNEN